MFIEFNKRRLQDLIFNVKLVNINNYYYFKCIYSINIFMKYTKFINTTFNLIQHNK